MTTCPDCGAIHDTEPCRREGSMCDCCDSIEKEAGGDL
jgi:hypothetical protein